MYLGTPFDIHQTKLMLRTDNLPLFTSSGRRNRKLIGTACHCALRGTALCFHEQSCACYSQNDLDAACAVLIFSMRRSFCYQQTLFLGRCGRSERCCGRQYERLAAGRKFWCLVPSFSFRKRVLLRITDLLGDQNP